MAGALESGQPLVSRSRKERRAAELPFKCGRSQHRCEEHEVRANILKLKLIL